jgi:4-amino-4-deoxy-L-arabinose transferase-like glycosyltransferase
MVDKRNRSLLAAVLTLSAGIALFFSFYRISEAPAIWYDEGFYTQMAMNLLTEGRQGLQVAPGELSSSSYITVGYPLTLPVGLSYSLFGQGVTQGRVVMVFFLLGFVALSYFLVKRLYGPWQGAFTALFLSTFPMLYGNGKSVLGEVPGLFFLVLALLALLALERSGYRGAGRYAAVGLCVGLCVSTKMFFILLPAALFLTLLILWRHIDIDWKGFGYGALAFSLPVFLWGLIQFGADASVPAVLSYYSNPYAVENIFSHMAANALRFVTESTPFFTLVLMSCWSVALYLRRKESSVVEISAFIFCILVILSYLRLEGWYRYLFPATMIALVFLTSSMYTAYGAFEKIAPRLFRLAWVPSAVIIALSCMQLYQTAFSSYVAQYYSGTRTKEVTAALHALNPQSSVFLYNTPELAVLLPSKNYYQYLDPLPNVHIGEKWLSVLKEGSAQIVLVEGTTHEKNKKLFSHYQIVGTADRYSILQKSPR